MDGRFAPLGGTVDDEHGIAEFGGIESDSGDAGAENKLAGIDEGGEIEASTGAKEGTHLVGKLLLTLDPVSVGGGGKGVHRCLAEFALATAAHNLAQAVELKHGGAGVEKRGGHMSSIIAERMTKTQIC
jgi:hypothetical protein